MWYVMQVFTGKEEEVKQLCQILVDSKLLLDCFYPLTESSYKKRGIRKTITRPLFPGYLFLVTEDIQKLNAEMRLVPKLTKILKIGEAFIPITEEEQEFIEHYGNEAHVFEMSRGYLAGDAVVIVEGAMAGFTGTLLRIDRHNRYGVLEVEMFGRKTPMQFGLEVLKSQEEWEQWQMERAEEAGM